MRYVKWLAALAIASSLASPALAAAPKDGDKSGDWSFVCPKTDDKKAASCQLVQVLTIEKDGQKGRLLQLTLAPQADKSIIMVALLPLGLHIPSGVAVKVDEQTQRPMILQRCTNAGCEAAMKVDDAMLAEMKKGAALRVGFNTDSKGNTMVAPASLKGLTDALAKLK
jgi:invasion protein IalB